jgi:hypothetical protein
VPQPETHTTIRSIRMGALWDDLEKVVGKRGRSALFAEFAAWYLRKPGAKQLQSCGIHRPVGSSNTSGCHTAHVG